MTPSLLLNPNANSIRNSQPTSQLSGLHTIHANGQSTIENEMLQGQDQAYAGVKISHKEAEQKRRDVLKQAFDDVRAVLPPIDKNPSKVCILQRARERILQLEEENRLLKALLHSE